MSNHETTKPSPPVRSVYLDNNATTPVVPEVREAMLPYLGEHFANPSSPYNAARAPARAISEARAACAALIGAAPDAFTFTSGGTESINTALAAALRLKPDRKHIVTSSVEHVAVLRYCDFAEACGWRVTRVGVDRDGRLDMDAFDKALEDAPAIVSVMAANNETGILFPIPELSGKARAAGALFHTDAVQAAGKIPVDVGAWGIDFLSVAAHKLHGPKGIGGLYTRPGLRAEPLIRGGEQEYGRRGGTENVPGIAGFGRACELALGALPTMESEVGALRDLLESGLSERVPGIRITGRDAERLPNTAHVLLNGVEAEAVLGRLDMEGIACSSGSACMAGAVEPSHVLRAMGFSEGDLRGAIRFSLSRMNTRADIEYVVDRLPVVIETLPA